MSSTIPDTTRLPWYRELNRYHWFVLFVCALGWLFDTMDQQLFVLARTPALTELLGSQVDTATLTRYTGEATAIFMFGWATGGLVFGLFGDRWGRARTMLLTILIYSLFTGLSAFSIHWWDFAIYRFLTGMGVGGEFAAGVSLVAEVMPSRARPYALALLQALSAVGNMLAAVISLLIGPQAEIQGVAGWRLMFLVGILPGLLVVLIRLKLKEPESWLRAKAALQPGQQTDEFHRQLGDLRELFRDRRWRYHTVIGVILSAAGVMALWGVAFWTPELIRNNVLQDQPATIQDLWAARASFLQYCGLFLGISAFGWLAGRLGRRPAFAVSFVLSYSAIVMVFGFMTQASQIWWMMPILGFCVFMPFGGYAIYFPELFPTRLRSTGIGFCYNVARYGAAAAPWILGHLVGSFMSRDLTRAAEKLSDLRLLSALGSVDNAFRYAALSVASILIVGLLILPFAPETKDEPLPE